MQVPKCNLIFKTEQQEPVGWLQIQVSQQFYELRIVPDNAFSIKQSPSNEVVIEKGIIPIIAARANSIGNILKTEKGNHFRAQYIPRVYYRLIGKLYNLRTTVERKNSNDVVGYNRSKTLTRGNEWAKIYVSISNIAALLTARTAFKVG